MSQPGARRITEGGGSSRTLGEGMKEEKEHSLFRHQLFSYSHSFVHTKSMYSFLFYPYLFMQPFLSLLITTMIYFFLGKWGTEQFFNNSKRKRGREEESDRLYHQGSIINIPFCIQFFDVLPSLSFFRYTLVYYFFLFLFLLPMFQFTLIRSK